MFGGDGGGVSLSEGITVILIGDSSRFDFKPQVFLAGFGLLKPLGVILMEVIVFLQLIIGGYQGTAVIINNNSNNRKRSIRK